MWVISDRIQIANRIVSVMSENILNILIHLKHFKHLLQRHVHSDISIDSIVMTPCTSANTPSKKLPV